MKKLFMKAALVSLLVVAAPLHAACNTSTVIASKPDEVLRDNGDGSVYDKETGLVWMKCPLGLSDLDCGTGSATNYTWEEALAAVTVANAAVTNGYDDWRLPSIAELGSIIESACVSPAINESFFPVTPLGFSYWSSSPYRGIAANAWAVNFDSGTETDQAKNNTNYVRLVRN